MAMDFPSSPTVGQVFTFGGTAYTWNGYAWIGGGVPLVATLAPGHVLGEPSSGKAIAGEIGELIENLTATGVGIGASGATFNVLQITLTPGDWDVCGWVMLNGSPISSQTHIASISTTSGVHGGNWAAYTGPFQQFYNVTLTMIPDRASISVNTIFYLTVSITYNGGGGNVTGKIRARRMR